MGKLTQRQNRAQMLFFIMEKERIQNLSDFISAITGLAKETKLSWWYRGHTNAKWDLLPAARRGYSKKQERHLSNEFYVPARVTTHVRPRRITLAGWRSCSSTVCRRACWIGAARP